MPIGIPIREWNIVWKLYGNSGNHCSERSENTDTIREKLNELKHKSS